MQVEGQRDASSKGLGFVLLQDGRPVTYTSKALTSAEQKYSQTEKELLAQVFGMEQHHQYRKSSNWPPPLEKAPPLELAPTLEQKVFIKPPLELAPTLEQKFLLSLL